MLGAIATGETEIDGLLRSADTEATADALRRMGVEIRLKGGRAWIAGVGPGGLAAPRAPLDLGNSGTGARLLMGLIAGAGIAAQMTGDASLRRRPMGRVMAPLTQMGAQFDASAGDRLPLTLRGPARPRAIDYVSPVPSAQVKSAILLAGLAAEGTTRVVEAAPTRDHTERMLTAFGADLRVSRSPAGATVALAGPARLTGAAVAIPADPSAAAFAMAAALITEGSEILIEQVLMNPLRIGLFATLNEMGADLRFENRRRAGGEEIADLRVRSARLRGVEVPADRAPSMIDEYPILAVVAVFAEGETVLRGLGELRVKESDRLQAVVDLLAACGAEAAARGDDLILRGAGGRPRGGAVETRLDHRIAMAALILGLGSREGVVIDDSAMIATSYPDFIAHMRHLGADIGAAGPAAGAGAHAGGGGDDEA